MYDYEDWVDGSDTLCRFMASLFGHFLARLWGLGLHGYGGLDTGGVENESMNERRNVSHA